MVTLKPHRKALGSKLTLILILVGALFSMGAKLPEKPIRDFKSVAGTWKGSGIGGISGMQWPLVLHISEDGSYEIPGHDIKGTMRIIDGKIQLEAHSPFPGEAIVTLYEIKGKRVLKAVYGDGTTWQVKPAKEKRKKKKK